MKRLNQLRVKEMEIGYVTLVAITGIIILVSYL